MVIQEFSGSAIPDYSGVNPGIISVLRPSFSWMMHTEVTDEWTLTCTVLHAPNIQHVQKC